MKEPPPPRSAKFESLGKCPCGGDIAASSGARPAVAHSIPYCLEFKRLEPTEFLAYVRRSRGIPDRTL